MKQNIKTAKTKLFANSTIYYVPSKSGGDTHIVVRSQNHFFCDCKDFMTRRLPLFGGPGFSKCTHGRQVAEFINRGGATKKIGYKFKLSVSKPLKRFGVFTSTGYRSIVYPKIFFSVASAKRAIAGAAISNLYSYVIKAL